jgi:Na+/melibiose symporter-like transporter
MDMPGTESGPTAASPLTTGQRVALAIASLVMLLMLGLAGIAAATHAISGIVFLILAVIAVFISGAAIIYIRLNRKR